LYAFFRIADDIVDDPNPPTPDTQREQLEKIRREALGEAEPTDPVLEAFQMIRQKYTIPDAEIEEFIAAMEQDVNADGFDTHADLNGYLRGSSVAVAYMMLEIMQPENIDKARPHAKSLGEAFQLTNFLRDVREDIVEYDRIYLPQSTLREHGVSEEQIRQLTHTENFGSLIEHELQRTERLYRHGVAGIKMLPQQTQFAVLLSAILYGDHHRLIRNQDYDVLTHRPSISLPRRLSLLVRTAWHWRRTGDPQRTFEIVSTINSPTLQENDDDNADCEFERLPRAKDGKTGGVLHSIRSLIPIGDTK
jgi:phytoene synthase